MVQRCASAGANGVMSNSRQSDSRNRDASLSLSLSLSSCFLVFRPTTLSMFLQHEFYRNAIMSLSKYCVFSHAK